MLLQRKYAMTIQGLLMQILGGLANPIFVKVMHYKSSKEIWDKLKIIYEGNGKVKQAKLQLVEDNLRI
jgi:hypothetical protein